MNPRLRSLLHAHRVALVLLGAYFLFYGILAIATDAAAGANHVSIWILAALVVALRVCAIFVVPFLVVLRAVQWMLGARGARRTDAEPTQ